MSRLQEATRKLESAIERIDRAAQDSDRDDAQRVELRAALLDSKQDNARLEAVTSQAGDRLDSAIARLRAILES
ncbi:MAG: hypothetical protein OEM59_10400 [Rhodospirillales bacterium]|nr:hypothetical protein [Rhodospirillales bacterium]